MSATPFIAAMIIGPLLGVIVAFAADWPARGVAGLALLARQLIVGTLR